MDSSPAIVLIRWEIRIWQRRAQVATDSLFWNQYQVNIIWKGYKFVQEK